MKRCFMRGDYWPEIRDTVLPEIRDMMASKTECAVVSQMGNMLAVHRKYLGLLSVG